MSVDRIEDRYVTSLGTGVGATEGAEAETFVFVEMKIMGEDAPVVLTLDRESLKRFVGDLTAQGGRAFGSRPGSKGGAR